MLWSVYAESRDKQVINGRIVEGKNRTETSYTRGWVVNQVEGDIYMYRPTGSGPVGELVRRIDRDFPKCVIPAAALGELSRAALERYTVQERREIMREAVTNIRATANPHHAENHARQKHVEVRLT